MILCYPVIMSEGGKIHAGSINNLLGEKVSDKELLELVSCDKQISEDTPPAFIWHTFEDTCVPVENSLAMVSALTAHNINTEFHLFPRGHHGLSLCNDAVYGNYQGSFKEVQGWIDMAIRWVKNL